MKRPGPTCAVCTHPQRKEIDASTGPVVRVAKRFDVSKSALDRHRKHAPPGAPPQEQAPSKPAVPVSEAEALRGAIAQMNASLGQVEALDLPRLTDSIAKAGKRLRELESESEVSEEQIVRSPAFRAIVARFAEAVRPFPEAARAMLRALEGT